MDSSERLFRSLRKLYANRQELAMDDLPSFVFDDGREVVTGFLGEHEPDHILELGGAELLVVLSGNAYLLAFEDRNESVGLRIDYVGPLMGGTYQEFLEPAHVTMRFSHPRLEGKVFEGRMSLGQATDLRTLLQGWAEMTKPDSLN